MTWPPCACATPASFRSSKKLNYTVEDFGDIDFEKVYLDRGLVRDYRGRLDKNKAFWNKWTVDKVPNSNDNGKGVAKRVSSRQSFSDYAVAQNYHGGDLVLSDGLVKGQASPSGARVDAYDAIKNRELIGAAVEAIY